VQYILANITAYSVYMAIGGSYYVILSTLFAFFCMTTVHVNKTAI